MPRKSGPFDKPFDRLRAMSKVEWLMVLSKVEGHTRNADLTIVCHGSGCPDLSGPAGALRRGHGTKKDIPMLNILFLSCITLKPNVWVIY